MFYGELKSTGFGIIVKVSLVSWAQLFKALTMKDSLSFLVPTKSRLLVFLLKTL